MFVGFSETACNVVNLAEREARASGADCVRSEHLLVGLLHEDGGPAQRLLESFGFGLDMVRVRIMEIAPRDDHPDPASRASRASIVRLGSSQLELRFARRATLVLELALREALTLGSGIIEDLHMLLALTRDPCSTAMRILLSLDAELAHTEDRVDRQLDLDLRNAIVRQFTGRDAS